MVDTCSFQNNIADDGGAMYCSNIGSVQNSAFMDNTAVNNGGAIYLGFNGEASAVISVEIKLH